MPKYPCNTVTTPLFNRAIVLWGLISVVSAVIPVDSAHAATGTYSNPISPTTATGSLLSRGPKVVPATTPFFESLDTYRTTACAEPTGAVHNGWHLWCVTPASAEHPYSGVTHFFAPDGVNWEFRDAVTGPGLNDVREPHVSRRGNRWVLHAVSGTGPSTRILAMSAPGPDGPWTEQSGPVAVSPNLASPSVIGETIFYVRRGVGVERATLDARGVVIPGSERLLSDSRFTDVEVTAVNDLVWMIASDAQSTSHPADSSLVVSFVSESETGEFVDSRGLTPLNGGGDVFLGAANTGWIAPAHPSLVTDAGGNHWTFYDATNTANMRREVLFDRVTFPDAVPRVRGGQWTSSGAAAGPSARPLSDPFMPVLPIDVSDATLMTRWTFDTAPAPQGYRANPGLYRVRNGELVIPLNGTDLAYDTDSAMVLGPASPAGPWSVWARVATPATGRAGLVVFEGEDNYLELSLSAGRIQWRAESGTHLSITSAGAPAPQKVQTGPATHTWLRIDREITETGAVYTAWTSLDGERWTRSSVRLPSLGSRPVVGVAGLGGAIGSEARFDEFRVYAVN